MFERNWYMQWVNISFNNNTLATHVLLLFLYSPQNIFMIILLLFNDIFDINEGILLIPTSVCCFRIERMKKIDDNNNIKRFSLTKHFNDLKVDFCQQAKCWSFSNTQTTIENENSSQLCFANDLITLFVHFWKLLSLW